MILALLAALAATIVEAGQETRVDFKPDPHGYTESYVLRNGTLELLADSKKIDSRPLSKSDSEVFLALFGKFDQEKAGSSCRCLIRHSRPGAPGTEICCEKSRTALKAATKLQTVTRLFMATGRTK